MNLRVFLWVWGSGRCPSGETSRFCFRWPLGEPKMIFLGPDQAPRQLRIFLSTMFIFSRESRPMFHIFEKTWLSKKLEYSTSSERCATPWYIETCALRIYFYVRSVKLHFGEFSKLTFQAVSWSLLFSAPAACFMMPVGRPDIVPCWETRHCCLLGDQTSLPVDRGHCSLLTEQTLYIYIY